MYRLLTISCFVAAVLFLQVACDDDDITNYSLDLAPQHHQSLYDGSCVALVVVKIEGRQGNCYKVIDKIDWYSPKSKIYLSCWCSFQQFKQCHNGFFQAWANRKCRPYIGYWSAPNCKYGYVFVVYPTCPCWKWTCPIFKPTCAIHGPEGYLT